MVASSELCTSMSTNINRITIIISYYDLTQIYCQQTVDMTQAHDKNPTRNSDPAQNQR